ncbi:reverse transcriptase domain-containing protein [Tanacetum coccineum]|uniref:Reverse transcriptase domain-containing protein n=1 Tax=Tanacetum coccineum TaxID=301880 RepID=A0ABQ4ZGA7_9ASTR
MAKIAVGEGITRNDFLDCHLPGEWEIARDAELNPFKDTLVFRRMVIFDEKELRSRKAHLLEDKQIPSVLRRSFSAIQHLEAQHERDISAAVREFLKQNTKLQKMLAKLDKGLKEKKFLDDINENLTRNKEIWIGIILKIQEREVMQSQYGNQFNVVHNTHSCPQTQSFTFRSLTVTYGGSNRAYYTSSTTRRAGSDGGHTLSRHLKLDGQVDSMQTLHNINKERVFKTRGSIDSGTGFLVTNTWEQSPTSQKTKDSDIVRIYQKSQENRQKRANTDTRNGRAEEKPKIQSQSQKSQPSVNSGQKVKECHVDSKKAQGCVGFTLLALTQVTQAVTSKDCQLGNPFVHILDPRAKIDSPMSEIMKGTDYESKESLEAKAWFQFRKSLGKRPGKAYFPEFDIEIKNKKGAENVTTDHLSRLENPHLEELRDEDIDDNFPGETLMNVSSNDEDKIPWFADFTNYLVGKILRKGLTYAQRSKFFSELKHYFWDDPYLFKMYPNGMIGRCIYGSKTQKVLDECHHDPTGGHYGPSTTAKKVFDAGFYWPTIFKEAHTLVQNCDACQRSGSLSREKRFLQLHELDELRLQAYENSKIYKVQTKAYHDKKLRIRKEIKARDKLYDKHGGSFIINGHRVKLYHDEEQINELTTEEIHLMCKEGKMKSIPFMALFPANYHKTMPWVTEKPFIYSTVENTCNEAKLYDLDETGEGIVKEYFLYVKKDPCEKPPLEEK